MLMLVVNSLHWLVKKDENCARVKKKKKIELRTVKEVKLKKLNW